MIVKLEIHSGSIIHIMVLLLLVRTTRTDSHILVSLVCDTVPRDSTSFIRRFVEDYNKSEKLISRYKKEKSFAMKDVGYQTYFGLSSSALNTDTSFEVKEDATKAQIKSAFKKSLSAKKMNKKILGEFISLIA